MLSVELLKINQDNIITLVTRLRYYSIITKSKIRK